MDLAEIRKLVEAGESEKVEFEKSTGQLTRAGETLCAFLNAGAGQVLIGVTPEGKIIGQQVSDTTLRDIAAMLDKFEPPAPIDFERVPLKGGREIVALRATSPGESLPFTFRRRLVERWGRGTQMIVELCVKAGHPEPEFEEESGAFGVRFLPSDYIAPHRVAHDLTERQREILKVLSQKPSMPLREIRAGMAKPPSDRRLREELLYLKRLGLVRSEGYGRGSKWVLERSREE